MSDLRDLLSALPPEATVPVGWVLSQLEDEPEPEPELTWKERLWTVPEETRIGVREVAEAVGHGTSWVYRRTMATATERLPHRKLESGELVFLAGELREWMRAREAA